MAPGNQRSKLYYEVLLDPVIQGAVELQVVIVQIQKKDSFRRRN